MLISFVLLYIDIHTCRLQKNERAGLDIVSYWSRNIMDAVPLWCYGDSFIF